MDQMLTLPGDDIRQLMWRFSDRFDYQMLIQATRAVARGPVARLVAEGARNTHEWTEAKRGLLSAFDDAGITAAGIDPEFGGYLAGPKNFVLAMLAFELAWVDAGAATCSLAGDLALAPIHQRGTPEQKAAYMSAVVPGAARRQRGAFALTEPIPFVGVDTGVLGGKMRIHDWPADVEPTLEVEKRGRFITNMGFATFVTAAVESDDPRIKGSCMVILEETDPGLFDRGLPTRKLVHQLSSTRDPILNLRVPASRIIGGYTVRDGVLIPNYTHGEVIEAVFRRTRVTVALMTAAKLLSAIEPIIRYHRTRFRGGDAGEPGSVRHEMGLQQKEDALHRLIDVWATGESAASLGFEAARLFDQFDPLEARKLELFAARGLTGRHQLKEMRRLNEAALELIELEGLPEAERDAARFDQLQQDELVQFARLDALTNVLCPAAKLWNTGHGANMMREAVSLMGGYGITEDCPGFLGQKWMDAQLEATYEGPEAVQRRQLTVTMTNEVFLAQFRQWIGELRRIGSQTPDSGACGLATAMQMWLWTLNHLRRARDAEGQLLYQSRRQGVTFPLADALCWLLATRSLILDVEELKARAGENPVLAENAAGIARFYTDLCHVQAARACGEVGRICAELVYGYNAHPAWDAASCDACYDMGELDEMESVMPGIGGTAVAYADVKVKGEVHPPKAGPCVRFDGMNRFLRLRLRMDGCLTGSRLAKDRLAHNLTRIMIPEALDYPR